MGSPQRSFGVRLRRTAAGITRAMPLPRGKRRVAYAVADLLGIPQQSEPGVVRMAAGFKLAVDLSSKNQRRMYFSGIYEPNVTKVFKALIANGDIVIDGGANIGYFSLLSSLCVGAGGSVHAFEPVPSTYQMLQHNVELNARSNVYARQLALSNTSSGLTFELPRDERTGTLKDWAASSVILGQGPVFQVESCILDEYAATHDLGAIKLVKLDLEGAELSAIEGMRQLLTTHQVKYLVCELNAGLLDAVDGDRDAVRRTLQQHGYHCYHIDQRGKLHSTESPLVNLPETVGDYLFVAPGMPIPTT